ncbi:hypothetical protein CPB86DRAFT_873826 [Serendipita vermifera]|nr:hypothetical protein CPB86DRAFT_873826 [Serendipita vermifera]
MAKQLEASANDSLTSFRATGYKLGAKDHPRTPTSIPPIEETDPVLTNLGAKWIEATRVVESVHIQASQMSRDTEGDVESSKSMLYFLSQNLASLLDVKKRAQGRVLQMRDITSARCSMPDELWLQVFHERVTEDEIPYTCYDLSGPAPYTTLRLTWVCRLWRMIITEQPSLWQFVAIPVSNCASNAQLERAQYFVNRMRNISPSKSQPNSSTYSIGKILQKFKSFKLLKLHVPPNWSGILGMPESYQPKIQVLVLLATVQGNNNHDTPMIVRSFFKNVESLSAIHVRLEMDYFLAAESYIGQYNELPRLESIRLRLGIVSQHSIISFLKASPALKSLSIEHRAPRKIFLSNNGTSVTLPSITSISCNINLLCAIFTSGVGPPNLTQVTLLQAPTNFYDDSNNDPINKWNEFLSSGHRRRTISALGLSAHCIPSPMSTISETSMQFIEALPNLRNLALEDSLVLPALLKLPTRLSASLTNITIFNCSQVTEELLYIFLSSVYRRSQRRFSLHITDCPSISDSWKRNLPRLLEYLANETLGSNTI